MKTASSSRFLEGLLQGRPDPSPLASLNRLRAEALERAGALSLPTTRDEDWRFTDLSPLTQLPLQPARASATVGADALARWSLPEAEARLVFVDGRYSPQLSFNRSGIVVSGLAAAAKSHEALLAARLGSQATFAGNLFVALNTAFLQDGSLICVPRNHDAAAPVHLLHIATTPGGANYPRCLVVGESGSALTLVEDFVSLGDEAYFTNAVCEIALADNARMQHVRVQRESAQAFHIANCAVHLARAARYHSVSIALGARLSRHNLGVVLAAEAGECSIDGLALVGASQLADTHTLIDHASAHAGSRQLHKTIVDGNAHAVFNGNIKVRAGAMRTDSSQSSRNLLLSPRARVDTKPQLEIFADDVKCAHGATVGQLDMDEIFYLKSRGLSERVARNLLTYAFAADVIERMSVATLRARLEQAVLARTQSDADARGQPA